MQIKPASAIDDYPWIYPGDDAIAYPDELGEDATKEEREARLAAAAHVHDELEMACETGDFDRVPCKPGQRPAIWTLQHVRGRALRWLTHRSVGAGEDMKIIVSHVIAAHALVEVRGLFAGEREFEVEREFDREVGFETIKPEQMEALCSIDGGLLVSMLAVRVQQSVVPKKKA